MTKISIQRSNGVNEKLYLPSVVHMIEASAGNESTTVNPEHDRSMSATGMVGGRGENVQEEAIFVRNTDLGSLAVVELFAERNIGLGAGELKASSIVNTLMVFHWSRSFNHRRARPIQAKY